MWTITKDLVDDGMGVGTCSRNYDEVRSDRVKFPFRMFDDDGNLYYEGLSDDCDSEKGFAPLDDFGMRNAGCTEIHYLSGKTWQQL